MTPLPLISIIVPCYNAEKFLKRNLDSITGQTYLLKEVIIVDGASGDNSFAVARQFMEEHSYIHWFSEKDNGVYDAMNKGIQKANGEWIYFLGADDIFYNENVLTDIFSGSYPVKAGMIYGNVEFLYSKMIYNGAFNLKRILFGGNICHQAIFYRKSVFQQVGLFDLNCKIYADHDFNIRCFRSNAFKKIFVNRLIAVYNEQDGISAIDKSDPVFREKQLRYIDEYNRAPARLVLHAVQRCKKYVKRIIKLISPDKRGFN